MKGIQSNGFLPIIAQAIAEMEAQHGEFSSIDEINLAELGRRTGLSRAKLRRLKANGFCKTVHGLVGKKKEHILDGYSTTFLPFHIPGINLVENKTFDVTIRHPALNLCRVPFLSNANAAWKSLCT